MHEKILLKLFEENPVFNQLYYSRFADLMNTVYNCNNMNELLDRMIAEIEEEMPGQIKRWGGTMEEWKTNLDALRTFINMRCNFLNDHALECHNEVNGQYDVTIMTQPDNIAQIDFNTLTQEDLPWTGAYFGNMDNLAEVRLFDAYKNDYVFSHWESKMGNNISPSAMNSKITYRLSMPDTLIAHFEPLDGNTENEDIVINEFMASNDNTVQDQDGEYDDWIELYNKGDEEVDLSGYYLSDNAQNLLKYSIPENTIIGIDEYLIIWADEDGSQDGLHANFKLAKSGETLFLINADSTIIDQITFADQETDVAFARKPNGTGNFEFSDPTFNANNDNGTSVSHLSFSDDQLMMYPNPANYSITVQLKKNGHKLNNVIIRDILGKIVFSDSDVNDYQLIIDISHLPSGTYIMTANDFYSARFFKK